MYTKFKFFFSPIVNFWDPVWGSELNCVPSPIKIKFALLEQKL